MCGLCGLFGGSAHWSEQAGMAGARPLEALRRHRVEVANRLLAARGLKLAAWAGRYTVSAPTGGMAVVDDLAQLWQAAERLGAGGFDPLDPGLLDRLERRA